MRFLDTHSPHLASGVAEVFQEEGDQTNPRGNEQRPDILSVSLTNRKAEEVDRI